MAAFNPPPNWPPAPSGWTPPPGWQPDPAWGPPPPGWQLWTDEPPKRHSRRRPLWASAGAGLLAGIVIGAVVAGGPADNETAVAAATSVETQRVTETATAPTPR
jgi:hypothetical protein